MRIMDTRRYICCTQALLAHAGALHQQGSPQRETPRLAQGMHVHQWPLCHGQDACMRPPTSLPGLHRSERAEKGKGGQAHVHKDVGTAVKSAEGHRRAAGQLRLGGDGNLFQHLIHCGHPGDDAHRALLAHHLQQGLKGFADRSPPSWHAPSDRATPGLPVRGCLHARSTIVQHLAESGPALLHASRHSSHDKRNATFLLSCMLSSTVVA